MPASIASLFDFGVKGNGGDDTAAIQAAINAVQGKAVELFIPGGEFKVSRTLNVTAPISMRGVGPGIGPGVITNECSRIVADPAFTSGDVISVSSYYGSSFRDFQIAEISQPLVSARAYGAGLHISAPNPGHSVNAGSRVENMCFVGFDVGLNCTLCTDQVIRASYFQGWRAAAYYVDNGATTIESSAGHVIQNKFYGDYTQGTAQQFGILTRHGYATFADNIILGSATGICLAGTEHNVGNLFVKDNSIEEQLYASILISQTDPFAIGSIQVTGNEFSNITNTGLSAHVMLIGPTSSDLFNADVSSNNFSSNLSGSSAGCINIQAGSNVSVDRNRMNINGGYAAIVGSRVLSGAVRDNLIQGKPIGDGYYIDNPAVVLRR